MIAWILPIYATKYLVAYLVVIRHWIVALGSSSTVWQGFFLKFLLWSPAKNWKLRRRVTICVLGGDIKPFGSWEPGLNRPCFFGPSLATTVANLSGVTKTRMLIINTHMTICRLSVTKECSWILEHEKAIEEWRVYTFKLCSQHVCVVHWIAAVICWLSITWSAELSTATGSVTRQYTQPLSPRSVQS